MTPFQLLWVVRKRKKNQSKCSPALLKYMAFELFLVLLSSPAHQDVGSPSASSSTSTSSSAFGTGGRSSKRHPQPFYSQQHPHPNTHHSHSHATSSGNSSMSLVSDAGSGCSNNRLVYRIYLTSSLHYAHFDLPDQ